MEINVSIEVNVCVPDDEAVPIENLVSSLKIQNIEARILEQIITATDDKLVTSLCGEKYSKGDGNERYARAGTSEKKPITSVGQLNVKLNKVKDIDQNKIIKPIFTRIQFDGKKQYQPDIVMISVDFVEKMSYRDTVEELSIVIPKVPSRMTINRRVMEIGESIEISHKNACMSVAMADGTKSHSQEKGIRQNEINVIIGIEDERKVLLGVTVNKSWRELSETLYYEKALSDSAVIVSDGESELINAFSDANIRFQMDLIHGFRMLSYKLWEDDRLDLKQRKELTNELKTLLLSLKNVVVFQNSDKERIGKTINQVVDGMESLANRLSDLGCHKSAKFINEYSNTLVTFARLSINGTDIPWNSNIIERLMGEISKRVKHKWMRWTTRGLETILRLILVRYTDPQRYAEYRNDTMGRCENSGVKTKISINSNVI